MKIHHTDQTKQRGLPMGRRLMAIATALVLASIAAGCGSGDSGSEQKRSGTTKASSALPSDIASSGKIVVGVYADVPPSVFTESNGKVVGFEVDLLTEVGKRLGVDVKFQNLQFDALITSLKAGRVDLIAAGLNDTADREKAIDFVNYYASGITFLIQKGNPSNVKSTADICGRAVAVVGGSTQAEFLTSQDKDCRGRGGKGIKIVSTTSGAQNLLSLKQGKVDIVLNDLPNAAYLSATSGGGKDFEMVAGDTLFPGPYGFGVNKEKAELRDAVASTLQTMMDDGTYDTILEKWKVQVGAIDRATVNGGA